MTKSLNNIINVSSLNGLDQCIKSTEVRFNFLSERFEYPFFLQRKKDSGRLVVIFHGAKDQFLKEPPYFERWSWMNVFESNILNVSDPTLSIDKNLKLGWYLGNQAEYPLLKIVSIVDYISNLIGVEKRKIIFWGSSGGGFAALNASCLLNGTNAVAFNPQVDIKNYYKKHVARIEDHCFASTKIEDLSNEHRSRTCFITNYKKNNPSKSFFYVFQNISDNFHYSKHFSQLKNYSYSNLQLFNFKSSRGHSAENKGLAKSALEFCQNDFSFFKKLKASSANSFDILSEIIILQKFNVEFNVLETQDFINCFKAFSNIANPTLVQKKLFYEIAPYVTEKFPRGHVLKSIYADFLFEEGVLDKSFKLHKELYLQLGERLSCKRKEQYNSLRKALSFKKMATEKLLAIKDIVHQDRKLFCSGFIASHDIVEFLDGVNNWRRIKVQSMYFYMHIDCGYETFQHNGSTMVVLGDYFIAHGELNLEQIHQKYCATKNMRLFDKVSGRFAIFLLDSKDCLVLNDAFGSRTIYYAKVGPAKAVSSHVMLLANYLNLPFNEKNILFLKQPEYRLRGSFYMPADITIFNDAFGLAPNNYFSFKDFRCVRYYPEQYDLDTGGNFEFLVDEYFKNFSAWIKSKGFTAVLGLTSGIDSRAIIAALDYYGVNLDLVTWDRVSEDEINVINDLKSILAHHNHKFVPTRLGRDSDQALENVANISDINSGLWRGRSGLTAKMSEVVHEKNIFVRGLGGEICRGFYNRHGKTCKEVNAQYLANMYFGRKIKSPSLFFKNVTYDSFEGCMERSNVMVCSPEGYDNLDFIYWEHRMGMWASNLLNEMDAALSDFVGINSRPIYDAAFKIPKEERLGKELLLKVCALYNTKLAQVPIIS